MELFQIRNWKVEFSPEALSLLPFKALFDKDKSKDKKIAVEELSYIHFMYGYKSDFNDIVDEEQRSIQVKKYCITDKDWKPDDKVKEAIEFYKERQTTITSKLLEGALIYANKIDNYFRNVRLDEVDDNGKLKYDVKKGNDILKDLSKTIASIKELEEMVRKEKEIDKGLRGNRKKGIYAD